MNIRGKSHRNWKELKTIISEITNLLFFLEIHIFALVVGENLSVYPLRVTVVDNLIAVAAVSVAIRAEAAAVAEAAALSVAIAACEVIEFLFEIIYRSEDAEGCK